MDYTHRPHLLCDIANKDVARLIGNIKRDVPNLVIGTYPLTSSWEEVRRGAGPQIKIREGYDVFVASYCSATEALVADLISELSFFKAPLLILEFHTQIDSSCDIWGDVAWHKFVVAKLRGSE